jgi:hypothetical protein
MSDQSLLTEELSVGPARLRVDVSGAHPPAHVLEDTHFLDYRLAEVHVAPGPVADEVEAVM